MADDDKDLVSEVRIDGTSAAIADLNKYGAAGKKAFDDMAEGAENASERVAKASAGIDKNANKAADGLVKLGQSGGAGITFTTEQIAALSGQLKKGIVSDITKFGNSLRGLTTAAGRFGQRASLLVGAVAGIGVAFALSARAVAKSTDSTTTAIDDQLKSQTDLNNANLESRTNAINLAASQRALFLQFQRGEISFSDYSKALQASNDENREAVRTAALLKNAQDDTAEANERLKKSVDDRKAYTKLTDEFGGALTSSLIGFGRAVERTRLDIVNAFGPGVASLVDVFTKTLGKNSSAIAAYFADASKRLQAFITAADPGLTQALETVAAAGAAVFDGLLKAGPVLLDMFNNGLVPAIKGLVGFFDSLAAGINAVFGTKLTGGVLIATAAILQFSGGLRFLFALLRTLVPIFSIVIRLVFTFLTGMTPLGIAIRLAALALGIFLANTDTFQNWLKKGSDAIGILTTAFTGFIAFLITLPGRIGAIFTGAWLTVTNGATNAVNGITTIFATIGGFFTDLANTIFGAFVNLWGILSEGWTASVAFVTNAFQGIVAFFTDIGAQIVTAVTAVWQSIVTSFQSAVTSITNTFSQLLATARTYLQPIVDLLKSIIGLSGSASGETGGQKFATGGHVRGAGTGTSDSIPAWLSNNEFVMKAKAVRKYGAGLMRAINEGRFEVPGFAAGGLVSALGAMGGGAPRYAFADRAARSSSGGPTATLNLTIGGQQFNGLLAPKEVADRLVTHANAKKITSAGKRPTWNN